MASKLDRNLKKEIIRNLHAAIDCEMTNRFEASYGFYVESLRLVAEALRQDSQRETHLTGKERKNLIDFAKQSIGRISVLSKNEEEKENFDTTPSAPAAHVMYNNPLETLEIKESPQRNLILARYEHKMRTATTEIEKQNVELEYARQLVEQAQIAKNKIISSSSWAMQTAYKRFKIKEKLAEQTLKDSDLRKQQLCALCLQFNEESSWIRVMNQKLELYPNNEKLIREMLDNIFSDSTNPVKLSLAMMHAKVNNIAVMKKRTSPTECLEHFNSLATEIKEDLGILLEVLEEVFPILKLDRNSTILGEVANYYYFGPVKGVLIQLIRDGVDSVEKEIHEKILRGHREKVEMDEDAVKEAITKLYYLVTLHNPYDMVDCVVHVLKLLTTSEFDQKHCTSVGTDILLPRLCNVIIESKLEPICAEAVFVEAFMPSVKATGIGGFSVALLQSAVAHLGSPETREEL